MLSAVLGRQAGGGLSIAIGYSAASDAAKAGSSKGVELRGGRGFRGGTTPSSGVSTNSLSPGATPITSLVTEPAAISGVETVAGPLSAAAVSSPFSSARVAP